MLQDISQGPIFNAFEGLNCISESIIFEERMAIGLRAVIIEFIYGRRCLKAGKVGGVPYVGYDICIVNDE